MQTLRRNASETGPADPQREQALRAQLKDAQSAARRARTQRQKANAEREVERVKALMRGAGYLAK